MFLLWSQQVGNVFFRTNLWCDEHFVVFLTGAFLSLLFFRDLHWGNVLVKSTKQQKSSFLLNGTTHSMETRGVLVRIIDYSLSRLEIGQMFSRPPAYRCILSALQLN